MIVLCFGFSVDWVLGWVGFCGVGFGWLSSFCVWLIIWLFFFLICLVIEFLICFGLVFIGVVILLLIVVSFWFCWRFVCWVGDLLGLIAWFCLLTGYV